jgi:ribosomal protein S3
VKKARVRKAPSREKLVGKLKYCRQDNEAKVVSINPVDIIGSQELWVYNTKTRKLGKYVAEHLGQLGVKGTTITGYDTTKSVAKTLRKPLEQLKEFTKAGKVALRTFLKDIKAVEIQLNGRIGTDVVLLKVQ